MRNNPCTLVSYFQSPYHLVDRITFCKTPHSDFWSKHCVPPVLRAWVNKRKGGEGVGPLNCIYIWNGHWLLSYSGYLKPPCSLLSLPLPPLTELYCLWLVGQFCFAKMKARLLWCFTHVVTTPVIERVYNWLISFVLPKWKRGCSCAFDACNQTSHMHDFFPCIHKSLLA